MSEMFTGVRWWQSACAIMQNTINTMLMYLVVVLSSERLPDEFDMSETVASVVGSTGGKSHWLFPHRTSMTQTKRCPIFHCGLGSPDVCCQYPEATLSYYRHDAFARRVRHE